MQCNGLSIEAEYAFQSETFFTADNNSVDRQGSYVLLNLTLGYLLKDGKFDISLWGRNLSDEKYITTTAQFPLVRAGRAGPPQTYGVRFSWNY